jgi:exonuclease SbcC
MFLQSLKLKNIRSYIDQTIDFTGNSTLLSGDIGSGKSTLLLAIEFALFGISKPDLTGETLLRKGETHASVELSFQVDNQNVTIQRNLKKNKNNISQTSGQLIINNLKKDLTPVELKTEIINLLHYPEELIAKGKNYIFRYTLYCPQEEMRLILQENPDNRLDTLRKIFNLDKYKKIRENTIFYLKKMRLRSTVLKTRLEPLNQKKEQLKEFRNQKEQLSTELNQLLPKLKQADEQIYEKKRNLEKLEKKNHLHIKLKNQLSNLQNILKEKQNLQQNLSQKQKQLEQEISSIVIPETKEIMINQLEQLQKQHQKYLSKKSELDTKIQHCQQQVEVIQKEISLLTEQVSSLNKKEKEIIRLKEEINEKEELKKEKENLEQQLDWLKQTLQQEQFILSHSEKIKEQISNLDLCPTCLQQVSQKHKSSIFQKEQKKIEKAEKQSKELEQKKLFLQKDFLEINQQFESLLQKEKVLTKLQTELINLKEKQTFLKEKKEQLQNMIKENNFLIKELEKITPHDLEKLSKEISQKHEMLQKIIRKQGLEKNLRELSQHLKEITSQVNSLAEEKNITEQESSKNPELTKTIGLEKILLNELTEKEKNLLSQKTRINTQKESLQQHISLFVEEIDRLNGFKSHLTKLTEMHYWLEEFLIKLTYTIEKQVMLKIHHLFNNLFREWFSMLIEDENISSRLDDSFTPIIELNGYEISFNNLSGGERTAASLSYRLALNKVINDIIYEIKTKDLLILDEPTDGFSSEQLDKVRDVLEKLNLKQTLIVSHESKIESFVDNVIRINKSEGVSQII